MSHGSDPNNSSVSCLAELLPFSADLKLRPQQIKQYCALKDEMLAQQRLDTMIHQRPSESPLIQPRLWWKYAISCVTTRPNTR